MNIDVAVSLQYADFKSFGCIPRNGITGTNGSSRAGAEAQWQSACLACMRYWV